MANSDKFSCYKCKAKVNLKSQRHIFCEGECKKVWHVPKCSTINVKEFKDIVENAEKPWFCDSCKQQRQQRRSIMNATIANVSQSLLSTPSISASSLGSTTINDSEITLTKIYKKLEELSGEYKKIERSVDDVKKIIEDYRSITDSLIEDNQCLRNENSTLKRRIDNIELKIDGVAQHSLDKNIIINGIPMIENESPEIYIKNITKQMKINMMDSDIKSIERTKLNSKNSGLPPAIVVEFHNKTLRDEILHNRKIEGLNTQTIFDENVTDPTPIFICEQLTKKRQYIMKAARDLKRQKIIKYVWTKNGDILIRRDIGSSIVKIINKEQLDNFRNETN